MPVSVEEYNIGHRWTINDQVRLQNVSNYQIVKNQPFENNPMGPGGCYDQGEYTYKIYDIADQTHGFLRYWDRNL